MNDDWLENAACRADGIDPDEWFPLSDDPADSIAAVRICATCSVIAQCRAYAIRVKPTAGIWAGISAHQVDHLRRKLNE
jgi:WhiB family redox-sensing transcriptional regulator